jgi:hypothetical protein|tara:strand:- start:4566 stop:4691 length:126 start_codon:yes stop_codon:yes gene_type:complete
MLGFYIGFLGSAIIEIIRFNKMTKQSNILTEKIKIYQKRKI